MQARTTCLTALFCAFMLILLGCAVSSVKYNPINSCSTFGSQIELLKQAPAEGTYKTCGSLISIGTRFTDPEELNRQYKEQAKKYGANAVLIISDLTHEFNWVDGPSMQGKALAIQLNK